MAELRLDVTLNLAGFRSQLGKLAQTAGAYYYPVNVLINKKNLTTQLEAIGRTLGKKKYRIDLNDTSVGLAADKIEKLAASLKNLSGSIKIDFNAGGGTKTIGTAMKEMATKMAKESKGDINKAVAKMVEMRGEAPFGSGTRSIPGFKSAAKGMGVESAFKLFFQELNQVDPQKLRKALDDGSVMMMGENRELKQKFDKIQSSAESLAQDLRAMGETARTTGRASLSTGGKTLYPQNYGLKIASLLSQIDKLGKDLRKVSAQSGTELLDNLTELTSVLRTTSNSFVGISGFSDSLDQTLRRFDTATKTATAATNAYADRINRRAGGAAGGAAAATAGPGLLPGRAPGGALAISSREGASKVIEVQIRSAFNIIEDYHKTQLDNFTRNYKQNIDAYHKAILTQQLINTANAARRRIVPAIVSEGGQPRLPPAAERKMLPAESGLSGFRRIVDGAVGEYFKSVGHGPLNQGALPPLPRTPLMLPAAGETTAGLNRPRITTGSFGEGFASPFDRNRGYVPPGGFPSETKMPGGKQGPATFIGAGSQMEKFKTALDVATASSQNFRASQLPLIGGLKGIAGELGQATKQVLLYGAAYKGLSFVMSLPGQILNAAKNQQQFTNALKVSTQETGTFAKEMLFVDNVQRAFGLNLETTRTGFVRLFASMAPTGFDSGSIEKLFTGISAATAALQLTPDKAERVIYAFGQMASKGQIMAEELKGQLGDVLPGALAIFSKAAGMSVKDFSKAMEDGEFTGNRFREVFAKVSDELINRFGTGAQIAGKSLQGLINTVGGDFTRTLESFAPLADSAAQATLGPLSRMLRDVGIAAQIAMGEVERVQAQIKDAKQIVVDLKVGGAKPEQIKAAEQNVLALQMRYKQLNTALQDPAMVQRVNDIRNFTTELAKAGTFVMNLAGVIGNVLSPFLTILGGNFTSIVGNLILFALGFTAIRLATLLFTGTLATVNAVVAANGTISMAAAAKSTVLAGAFRIVGVQATGAEIATIGFGTAVKGLIASTGIGLLVVLVGSLATAFLSMRDRAKEAGEASKDAIKEGANAAAMGQVLPVTAQLNQELAKNRVVSEGLKTLERIHDTNRAIMKGGGRPIISTSDMASLKGAAEYSNEIAGIISGNQLKKGGKGFEIQAFLMPQLSQAREQAGQISAETRKSSILLKEQQQQALRNAKRLGLNAPTLGTGTNEGETEADKKKREDEEKKLAKSQDTLATRQQQLDQDAANRRVALDQSTFDSRLRMSDAEYDHQRALQDDYFERQISGLDSIEARQKKFQQDLKAIENRRIDSIRKAELDAVKAVQDLRSATVKAAAVSGGNPGGTSKYVDRSVLRKYLESEGFSRTSGDFTNKGHQTPDHMRNAMDYGILGGSDADALRKTIAMERKLKATGAFGDQLFGPERDPRGHGAGKGGQNIHLHVPTPDEKIKLTPGLSSLIEGKGLQGGAVGLNTRPGEYAMGRREDKAEGNLAVEQQDVQNKALEKLETIRRANNLALEQTITLVQQNIDSIFPVKEQKLENDLLEMRNNLELKGASKEIIDMEVQKYKAVKENAYNLQTLNEEIAKNNEELTKLKGKKITTLEDKEQIKSLTNLTAGYNLEIAGIPEKQRLFNEQLERTAALAVESPMVKLAKQVNEAKRELVEMSSASSMAIGGAKSIGEAFGSSFKDMITGSKTVKESMASLFQSVGDYFLDMGSRIISKWIEMQAIQGLMSIFSMFAPGAAVAGATLGAAPVAPNLQSGAGFSLPGVISTGMQTAANGAVWTGGFTAFADGGMVTGPTLGLVGEGRYNEAIIPLPDGRSVPVELGGAAAATNNVTSNIVVNVSSDGQSSSNANGSNSVDLGRKIEGAVKQVIVAELRPGGVLAGRR